MSRTDETPPTVMVANSPVTIILSRRDATRLAMLIGSTSGNALYEVYVALDIAGLRSEADLQGAGGRWSDLRWVGDK